MGKCREHDGNQADTHPHFPISTSYKVMWSLLGTLGLRSMLAMFCFYDRNESPLNLSWWLPVQIFVYSCVLDFWFYW